MQQKKNMSVQRKQPKSVSDKMQNKTTTKHYNDELKQVASIEVF